MTQATVNEVAGSQTKVKERVVEAERLTKLVPDKVHTWPYLVRLEMLVGTFVMAFMTIWSIVVDAPLEEPANPTKTPNPSKAPWYFLGLQEILVYFDPCTRLSREYTMFQMLAGTRSLNVSETTSTGPLARTLSTSK